MASWIGAEVRLPSMAVVFLIDLGGVVRLFWKLAQSRVCVSWVRYGGLSRISNLALQQDGTTVVDSPGVVWTIRPLLKVPTSQAMCDFHAVRFKLRLGSGADFGSILTLSLGRFVWTPVQPGCIELDELN